MAARKIPVKDSNVAVASREMISLDDLAKRLGESPDTLLATEGFPRPDGSGMYALDDVRDLLDTARPVEDHMLNTSFRSEGDTSGVVVSDAEQPQQVTLTIPLTEHSLSFSMTAADEPGKRLFPKPPRQMSILLRDVDCLALQRFSQALALKGELVSARGDMARDASVIANGGKVCCQNHYDAIQWFLDRLKDAAFAQSLVETAT
ncbi:MAG: hypothetical protein E6R03_14210 [Hyphomicrobiaceae bacterium]|nr:MAG: hypothetical protein E6R03_14210 [Hyphomicrobiaceae bacterium]